MLFRSELHDKSKYNKVVFDDKEFPSATALDSRIMFQPSFNISGKERKLRKSDKRYGKIGLGKVR